MPLIALLGCSNDEVETGVIEDVETEQVTNKHEGNIDPVNLKLEEFADEYNGLVNRTNNKDNDSQHLEPINIDEFESTFEKDERWHNVLSDSDDASDYGIELSFDDEMNILDYHVGISSEDGYSHFESAGLASATTIAKVLNLDMDLFLENATASLESDDASYKYEDAGYEIFFMDLGVGGSGTLIFEFRKRE